MTKKKKSILSIVAVVLALGVVNHFFGFQIACMINARTARDPFMDAAPKPLNIESRAEPATTITAFDYSFSVPWPDCNQMTFSTGTSLKAWACAGTNLTVVCFAPREGLYSSVLPDASVENAEARRFLISGLGLENVKETNFFLCQKMLEMTPGQISVFDSRRELAVKRLLIRMKASCTPSDSDKSCFFEHNGIKGFQFGNPSVEKRIHLLLFDQKDREVQLVVGIRTNSTVSVIQNDINTIITTFSSEP